MLKISEITKYLDSHYPKRIAEKWDNVGLIFGSKRRSTEKVIVALDLTKEVLDKAVDEKAMMIITHHPFIFDTTKSSLQDEYKQTPYKKEIVERLLNTKISLYVMHTNFDKKGMTLALANKLGIKKTTKIPKGYPFGFIGDINTTSSKLSYQLKELGISVINNNAEFNINKVAFFPGGSPAEFKQYIDSFNEGADLMVISEMKHHIKIAADQEGIPFIEVSHSIEQVMTEYVSKQINDKFKSKVKAIAIKPKENI